jgi:hypothetical protein
MVIEKFKSCNSLGFDQSQAELIPGGGRTVHAEIHKLINSVWNEKELPQQWKSFV